MAGILKKILGIKNLGVDVDEVVKESEESNKENDRTIRELRSTLNGEDYWLCVKKCDEECLNDEDPE